MRKHTQEKAFSENSTCRSTRDHDWIATTADNFRRCARSGCKAAQFRNKEGMWIDVAPLQKPAPIPPPITNELVELWG